MVNAPVPPNQRPMRFGVSTIVIIPAAVLSVVLEESGVPRLAIAGGLALAPVAAVLVPSIRRRWPDWGASICFACAIMASLQTMHGQGYGWLAVLAAGLAGGVLAIALTYATRVLARERSPA